MSDEHVAWWKKPTIIALVITAAGVAVAFWVGHSQSDLKKKELETNLFTSAMTLPDEEALVIFQMLAATAEDFQIRNRSAEQVMKIELNKVDESVPDEDIATSVTAPEPPPPEYLSVVTVGLEKDYDTVFGHGVGITLLGKTPINLYEGTWEKHRDDLSCGENDMPCVVTSPFIVDRISVNSDHEYYRIDDKEVSVVVARLKEGPRSFTVAPRCSLTHERRVDCYVDLTEFMEDELFYNHP